MSDDTKARLLLAGQGLALLSLVLPDPPREVRGEGRAGRTGGSGSGRRGPRRVATGGGRLLMLTGALLAGAGSAALGQDLRPMPFPRPGAAVRRSGAYALTRHPIYAGLLLGAAGRALASGGRRHAWAAAALAVIFQSKASLEERLLSGVEGYEEYLEAVPRWGIGKRG